MEFREPDRFQPPPPAHPASPPAPVRRRERGKALAKILLAIVLIAAAAAGAYYWRDKEAKDQAKAQAAQISDLQSQLNAARDKLADSNSQATKQPGPSADTLKKIQDAVKSGKYADLQSLLATKVSVILAASEGLGPRTAEQVVTDLKYLDGGSDPWDFNLAASVLSGYQDGDYAQYFPVGSLVGKSANGYVVSFVFNNAGKVTGIFMANKADIL